MSLSVQSPWDRAGNWRLWSTPPGHQSQLFESRLVIALGAPEGAWVGGSKKATGIKRLGKSVDGEGMDGPKAKTVRVGLKMQGINAGS